MPVAALTTLGCKVNQYETERIAEDFARAGFTLTEFDAPADVYVINSCSVTDAADRKSRYLARKAARTNPDATVIMTGCHSQTVLDRGEWVEGATLLVPNREKMDAFHRLAEARPDLLAYSSSPATTLPPRGHRTRATLKVQDGCEHFCGFCQIPYTRKDLVSRPWRDIVAEAAIIRSGGAREIVVTGVCVGAYGPETGSGGPDLAELLLRVADQPGIDRVRLSSIQPIEVTESLIDAFANHPRLCPHLHLSCQSGDDTILRAMNRPYSTLYYRDLVGRLRERIRDVAITTDLIVGYPGETRRMHENTLEFAHDVAFQRTHVFRYSPRPGTAAASLPDDVTDAEKKRRHAELQTVVDATNRAFTARYVGSTLGVLVERGPNGGIAGHTANYIAVEMDGPQALAGRVVPVHLTGLGDGSDARGVIDTPAAALAPHDAALNAPREPTVFLPLAMATS
jgi:threonylcarbamoyladenosine tRNA methylthiotransferase MtaB